MLIRLALAMVMSFGAVLDASAQTAPTRIIVPFAAGSSSDIAVRIVAAELARQSGAPIPIDNRPGPAGLAAAADLPPDGRTILAYSAPLALSAIFKKAPSFAPIATFANAPLVLVVAPEQFKSLSDLLNAAKARRDSLKIATHGAVTPADYAAMLLIQSAQVTGQPIPYRTTNEALQAVVDQQVDFYFSTLAAARPFLNSGRLRAIAVSSSKRSPALPDVPTTLELGLANTDFDNWIGFFAAPATPRGIIDQLFRAVAEAVTRVAAILSEGGLDPMVIGPDELRQWSSREEYRLKRAQSGDPIPGAPGAQTPPVK